MHTLSSASLTCIADESAVEWTATVCIPFHGKRVELLWQRHSVGNNYFLNIFGRNCRAI